MSLAPLAPRVLLKSEWDPNSPKDCKAAKSLFDIKHRSEWVHAFRDEGLSERMTTFDPAAGVLYIGASRTGLQRIKDGDTL